MGWLTNWDDLIHGTAVFGAALPLAVAFCVGWLFPSRPWIAVALALLGPWLWCFGWPHLPPHSSEDALLSGLGIASLLMALPVGRLRGRLIQCLLSLILWISLGWLLYPAWLAASGGWIKHALVSAAFGISIWLWSMLLLFLARNPTTETEPRARVCLATVVPPTLALAVLLQWGGATRLAQSTGALAAAVAAVTVATWRKPPQIVRRSSLGAGWAMLFALLAWCGWLFAYLQVGPTLALLAAPLLARIFATRPAPAAASAGPARPILISSLITGLILLWGWTNYGGRDLGY